MPPTFANGKECYIEMPATDIRRSEDFYQEVFGWRIRQRGDGRHQGNGLGRQALDPRGRRVAGCRLYDSALLLRGVRRAAARSS